MKKIKVFLPLSFLAVFISGASALDLNNPLPNWIDHAREKSDGGAPIIVPGLRAAPPSDFRIPAEYEPVGAVVIGWAGYTRMLTAIGQAATGPGKAQLWGVAAPASIQGVPAGSYSRIVAYIDTVWMRDYGPFGLSAGQGRPGIVDSIYRHYQYRRDDDALPANLGKAKNIDVFGIPIILDGGNLMMDSKGNLYMTMRTYVWNSGKSPEQVDDALKNYFKVKNIYTFEYSGYPGEPADGTGHIDMFMKLLNDHTVLIAVAEKEPFKSNSEKAIAFFKGRKAADGEPFKVITVKGWEDHGTWYTYTNSLLVNNVAIIPSYSGHSEEEAAAKAAYQAGVSGVTVVPVPSDESIGAGGSIHCVTQTIPVLPGRALKAEEVLMGNLELRAVDVKVTVDPLRDSGNSTAADQLVKGF
jgi:agmatine deiminase